MSRGGDLPIVRAGRDGGVNAVHFPLDDKTYSAPYLMLEGLFLHAKRTPNQVFVRLPKRLANEQEFIDVTYARAAGIVDYVMEVLPEELASRGIRIRHGSVVSLITLPSAHTLFVSLALLRLGCVVQWIDHSLGCNAMDNLLTSASSVGIVHNGLFEEEKAALGIDQSFQRVGLHAFELPITLYSASLATNLPNRAPREPITEEKFYQLFKVHDDTCMLHTSGSTGNAKLLRFTLWSCSKVVGLPPQAEGESFVKDVRPMLIVSRTFWGTSLILMIRTWSTGFPMSLCYPHDRLYPSMAQALCVIEKTRSSASLFYPAQIPELVKLVTNDPTYRKRVSTLKMIIFCGAGLDAQSNDQLLSMNLPDLVIVNLHGWSEVAGGTGLVTNSAPYHGLVNKADWAIFEPVDGDVEQLIEAHSGKSRLVKLWISLDRHPQAWYLLSRNLTTAKIEHFPGPGPDHDRPATNTGDIFEERETDGGGEKRYFFASRDDDTVALTNNMKPNVFLLESALRASLIKPGRLEKTAIDAVQIFGNMRPKLAAIVQLKEEVVVEAQDVQSIVTQAIDELDGLLPAPIRFVTSDRVKVIFVPTMENAMALLKTHKGTIRRALNARIQTDWLNSLVWD